MRHCALLIVSLFLCADAAAQLPLRFGIKAGPSFATLAGLSEPGFEKSMRQGITLGAVIAFPLRPQLALQAEWNFVMKGGQLTDDVRGERVTFELGYLEVPIMMRLVPASLAGFSPYVAAGPSFGLNFDARGITETSGTRDSRDIVAGIENVDFGLVVAGGVLTGLGLMFDVRYTLGVGDVGTAISGTDTVRNGVLAFTVGYVFVRR